MIRWPFLHKLFGKIEAQQVTYYISGKGDDLNTGKHPLQAWASIDRLNQERSSINPQDQILFERGYSYSGKPFYLDDLHCGKIAVGAYGSGNKPVFPQIKPE